MFQPLAPCPQFAHYFRCIDAANPPAGYAGDWPDQGTVYAGHVRPSVHTGEPHVFLDGFYAPDPWGAFAAERFEFFVTLSLN